MFEGDHIHLRCQNGFLVQHFYDSPYGMERIINTCGYNGLSARNSNPLSVLSDRESNKLSREAEWRMTSDQKYMSLEFISEPSILFRYIKACQNYDIPIRILFVESDYCEEEWTGIDIPKRFLGYEYNTIPMDNQIITDFSWHPLLLPFWERVNSWGLFPSMFDVTLFKNAYDLLFDQKVIGDGDVNTYIFCLYEVQPDDVIRCLSGDANCILD